VYLRRLSIFKVVEFDHFKMQAGLPNFVLSPGQWIEKTNAVGIYVKQGKSGTSEQMI
jgi:hypothetical protein